MADEIGIRNMNTSERRDMYEIGTDNFMKLFTKRLTETEQKFVKEHKPFCARCAKIEFQENVAKYIGDLRKKGTKPSITNQEILEKFATGLDKYGLSTRFTLLEDSEVKEKMNMNGVVTYAVTGYYQNFICNTCGGDKVGRVSVFVPIDDYKVRQKK